MTAKKYRTLGVGGVKPRGYQLLYLWQNGFNVGEVVTKQQLVTKEYRAPIVKRKKAGKK